MAINSFCSQLHMEVEKLQFLVHHFTATEISTCLILFYILLQFNGVTTYTFSSILLPTVLEEFMKLNEICSFLFIFSLVVEDPVEKWVISTQQQQLQTQ